MHEDKVAEIQDYLVRRIPDVRVTSHFDFDRDAQRFRIRHGRMATHILFVDEAAVNHHSRDALIHLLDTAVHHLRLTAPALQVRLTARRLRGAAGRPVAPEVDGAMHACGHRAHVAILVGAARVLARRRAELAGSVLFMFQPGEEGYHGARVLLEEGLLDGTASPTGAFALHVTHREAAGVITTRPGPMLASGDTVQITVRGKGGHASAPHDCLDPI